MKITWYKIKKGLRYLKHYGPKKFIVRLKERLEPEEVPYGPWYEKHKATAAELKKQREDAETWDNKPMVSICVPLYKTKETDLGQMIASVQAQSYPYWELCLADGTPDDSVGKLVKPWSENDKRIVYKHLEENLGIADNTNAAFAMAGGEWIGLLDHDDLLAPDALYEVLAAAGVSAATASKVRESGIQAEPAEAVYTDEDKISVDAKEHFQPHFKPDCNLDLLRSNNYITHFFVVKRAIVEEVGGFKKEFDGAQDYDFIFKCTRAAKRTAHVPRMLYHWRVSPESTADNPASKLYAFEAGKRAIEADLERSGLKAEVGHTPDYGFYRVKYSLTDTPLVSIVIPNKDEAETLKKCIASIQKSTYQNYEVIIVENNSTQAETFTYYEKLTEQPYDADKVCEGVLKGKKNNPATGNAVKVVTWKGIFNYSAINNFGVQYAKGEYLVLLNNDIELITTDWLEEMLANCLRKEVGIVGAKLLYDDNTVQHAGIVVGIGGIAANMFTGLKAERDGYMHKASLQMNYSAVTAACLMVETAIYKEVGGLTEELTVAFNDVDFCLKVRRAGYLVVYNPAVKAYHYESKSRGAEDTPEKIARFEREIAYIKEHWPDILKDGDPYYNKCLTLNKTNYGIKPL
ncbi:MAG: glycosyltransferase family 2 protein [Lachnospiraceae bacterium]|nr:glycosyltransferase family 2 protein [Lachnospiraceae bacterium]